jgi:hypothetical protein
VLDDDTPIYRQIAGLMFDPLAEIRDDHQVEPVDPGWFLSLDDVDSRAIRDDGAPP